MRSFFRAASFGCLAALIGVANLTSVAADPTATPVERIHLPEDFQAELLYSVPTDKQGSWVNMTPDPQGRLIVSDQYGSLYRVTPGGDAASTKVEKLSVDIGAAQGLLYAFDSLYVMVNGNAAAGSGLYRVQDTDGDDQFDSVKLLRKINGGGEHGPHAIVLSPDGKSLYVCGGNHTDIPNPETSRVPRHWQEDQLLPRMWDAGGHAVGKMAPGGWVCKTDPEGKSFELIGCGFRNEYDIAFNPAGDLFTYDADMEWDIGSPWYRPTRICNVTSGSEFGWRSGTGKWPTYYPDSLSATVDIGPGSPTGITFGTGARFPAKYQNALFIADWSFGLIYAVHLQPDGSSYTGTFERFATASPLPVTDIVINPRDGAMYFLIGGRRTQSGLYRVTYSGSDDTSPVVHGKDAGSAARQQRARLEALHTPNNPAAVDQAWPYLADKDRFLQFAARIAIEHQPVAEWSELALAEENPHALIVAMVALARCGDDSLQGKIIQALGRISWGDLSDSDQLGLLRAYGLAFARMGQPSGEIREAALQQLDGLFPAASQPLNRELSQLLIYLEAPKVATRTLKLLADAPTQQEQVHCALALRALKSGWTMDQRREYFGWFTQSGGFRGGNSFPKFLRNIRSEAATTLSAQDRLALASLIEAEPKNTDVNQSVKARPHVKKWTVADLLSDVGNDLKGRNFASGRTAFAASACFKCHRFKFEGGIIGPDLTSVGKRFTPQYVLESLIEPSKAISDQYQATIFVTDRGKTITGKVANLSGKNLMIITNMLEPGTFTQVNVDSIEEQILSPTSMMPTGLLDTLTRDEILDLVAYLRSGGNPNDPAFK
jgi:putative heme-binding domain-containing protein